MNKSKMVNGIAGCVWGIMGIHFISYLIQVVNTYYILCIIGCWIVAVGTFLSKRKVAIVGIILMIIASLIATIDNFLFYLEFGFGAQKYWIERYLVPLPFSLLLVFALINNKKQKLIGVVTGLLRGIEIVLLNVFFIAGKSINIENVLFAIGAIFLAYSKFELFEANFDSILGRDSIDKQLDELTKLQEFLEQGIIDYEEYEKRKNKILGL